MRDHAERRKSEKYWDDDDLGNYSADRAADKDYDSLRAKDFTIIVREIMVISLYNCLLEKGQWYIGFKDASLILPHSVMEHIQRNRHAQYISDRDAGRVLVNLFTGTQIQCNTQQERSK